MGQTDETAISKNDYVAGAGANRAVHPDNGDSQLVTPSCMPEVFYTTRLLLCSTPGQLR
jgi:hypothetical protein